MAARVPVIISMLHEEAAVNSATRAFRDRPVLAWTLQRLARARRVESVTILCWQDQGAAVREGGAPGELFSHRARRDWAECGAGVRPSSGWGRPMPIRESCWRIRPICRDWIR